MTKRAAVGIAAATCLLWSLRLSQQATAQGYGSTLTIQGMNQRVVPSAASRGAGGISVGLPADPLLMFTNPTSLQSINTIHIVVGGGNTSRKLNQEQRWLPLRNFPTFSLLMEGLIDQIGDPDLTEPPEGGLGPEDSIPRPYDLIKPNWAMSEPSRQSFNALVAMPFQVSGVKVVGGIGAIHYANLDHYFQNNNVLSPSLGTQRPVGIPLPAIGQLIDVAWTQRIQQRRGSIMGYGGAVSVAVTGEMSVGASGLALSGESDDYEQTVGRGMIHFGNNNNVFYHRLDSVYSRTTRNGTSEYAGYDFSASAMYRGENFSLSLVVRPPSKISRTFSYAVQRDTTGASASTPSTGTDKLLIPWRGTAGISFLLTRTLLFGFEYELRPFASAEYTEPSGATNQPWLSSSVFRAGTEFTPADWLAIRAGYREDAEVFEETGNALIGEPIRYSAYSVGIGLKYSGVRLNAAYEYYRMKYQDMWQTNVNLNSIHHHTIVADLSYVLE